MRASFIQKAYLLRMLGIAVLYMGIHGGTAAFAAGGANVTPTIFSNASLEASQNGYFYPDVTIYLPSGTLSPSTACPEGKIITMNAVGQASYNSDLSQNPAVAYMTCNYTVPHPPTITTQQALALKGITSSAYPGAPCPTTAGYPSGAYCFAGDMPTATASICYNDFASTSGCQGVNTSAGWVGVYWAFNGASASISNGTNSAPVPACSAGTLLLNLSGNTTYSFTYTRNTTFEQSYDGYKTSQGACTCISHHSITGNSPANSSCTASSITIYSGTTGSVDNNTISVTANAPASFLADSTSNPFTWLSGPVCTVGAMTH